ncbi:MAG: hypothetical protein Q8Q33_03960 [Chlamydiota bacterium]|nr:hypothetical protein [Chlamydiota bacterium]
MLAKRIALGFGIAIVFPMMIHYGVSIFYPKPTWSDYQVADYHEKYQRANPEEKINLEKEKNKLLELRKTNMMQFQKHLFWIGIPIGILAIVTGALLPYKAIGAGLMFGGLGTASNGYFNYWTELSDIHKCLSSLCILLVLLTVGFWKLEK